MLARWQEFVGTGELLRSLETRVGWLRDRVVNAVKGKPQQAERVTVAVESGLETLILEHAEAAAERAEASWQQQPPGRAARRAPSRTSAGPRATCAARPSARCASGSSDVLEMVRAEGADKRSTARFLAFGVNGLSVALMIVVFAHTAGLTGAEAGIAGGSAVLGQKLLEAVFGDQAVRDLAERARRSLEERVPSLLDEERARYLVLIDALEVRPEAAELVREASRRVDDLRFAAARSEPRPTRSGGLRDRPARGRPQAADPGTDIGARVEGLETAAQAARGRLDDTLVDEAEAVAKRAAARLRLSADHTVVGIAGATGSGKSSTYNALTGLELSAVGVRRPTTSWASACVWGSEGAGSCSSGSASRRATRPPATPCSTPGPAATTTSTASSCSTCPTTTPPRSRTTSRSTAWCSWPTCWCGCSTRRSTPTPRSTSATSPRCPPTPR